MSEQRVDEKRPLLPESYSRDKHGKLICARCEHAEHSHTLGPYPFSCAHCDCKWLLIDFREMSQVQNDLGDERKLKAAMLAELERVEKDLVDWDQCTDNRVLRDWISGRLESVRAVLAQARGES